MVEDIGETAAHASPGLSRVARCSVRNAERDTHRVLSKRMQLSLPVPLSKLGTSPELCYDSIRLRDWMDFMANKHCTHILCGLHRPDRTRERAILSAFWSKFREAEADHPIFDLAQRGVLELAQTFPLLYHGDEGRGRRRAPFLVCSWHSVLGRGSAPGRRARPAQHAQEYIKLQTNFRGHTFTTHFIHAGLPKTIYQDQNVFNELLLSALAEANFMASHGVLQRYSGEKFWCMVLGITGDWAWLHKAGNMQRSFNNVEKNLGRPQRAPAGICHLCRAGQRDIPFEQFLTRQPTWLQTCHTVSPFGDPSPLLSLPHVPGREAALFKFDLWHCFHLGVGKAFTASGLAVLSETMDGASKDARCEAVSKRYLAWCKDSKTAPILTRITKETLSWETNNDFPMGSWYKGSVTTNLCQFLHEELGNRKHEEELLDLIWEAAEAIDTCMSGLYSASVFLQPWEARDLGEHGLRFLRRYATLADKAVISSRTFFSLLPKHHAMQHLFLEDLVLAASKQAAVLNPICYTVQQSEDYIGRVSRTSRRVHPRTCVRRCLERHLQLAYSKYVEEGYLGKGVVG